MKRSYLLIVGLVVVLVGCTRSCTKSHASMSPEQVVEAYLDTAFSLTSTDQRAYLTRYTTGNLKHAIDTATDQTILDAYINRKFKIVQYSVVERTDRRPREVEIVFQLSFKETSEGNENDIPTTTTENTVSVVKENNLWLISNVLGKKTSIDFPVSPDSVIKASPGPGEDTPEVPAEGDEE